MPNCARSGKTALTGVSSTTILPTVSTVSGEALFVGHSSCRGPASLIRDRPSRLISSAGLIPLATDAGDAQLLLARTGTSGSRAFWRPGQCQLGLVIGPSIRVW